MPKGCAVQAGGKGGIDVQRKATIQKIERPPELLIVFELREVILMRGVDGAAVESWGMQPLSQRRLLPPTLQRRRRRVAYGWGGGAASW